MFLLESSLVRGGEMRLEESNILFVDDEVILGELWVAWLKRVAARVFYAENGVEALRILKENPINVIISDIRMPVMDGVSLLKEVIAMRASMPVFIFVTGYSDLSARDAYQMGAGAILQKPIDREELLQLVRRGLTDTEELWKEPGTPSQAAKVAATFDSLASAQELGKIAFGRRGFCIHLQATLFDNPVEFILHFESNEKEVSGQGIVRWKALDEGQYGIEITCLGDSSREWLIQFMKQNDPRSFIPSSAGRRKGGPKAA
jgi:CheY-like chemotaxis protein